jgi:sterol desaturase/sphingolipid hydroxylase (fatty acid hydroxylase superfamily)
MTGFLASHQHLMGFATNVVRACLLLTIVAIIFAPLEHIFAVRPGKLFARGWSVNLGWYFFNGLFTTLLLSPPALLIAWLIHSSLPGAVTGAAAALPLWLRMIAAMVVGEIGFYWGHRWSHEIPLLWRFHAVHHSAEHVNFLVNTRGHPVDVIFTRLCGLTLLYATGLASPVGPNPALVPMLVLFIGSLWSFFIHANVGAWGRSRRSSPARRSITGITRSKITRTTIIRRCCHSSTACSAPSICRRPGRRITEPRPRCRRP